MSMMKKWKLKALAAATALAISGAANAGIAVSGSGNGELFFSVWDSISETSYTRDLGLTLSQFVNQAGTFGTSAGGTHGGSNLVFGTDSVLSTWLSSRTAAALAGLQWNVAAMDGSGQNRYLTTAPGTPVPEANHGLLAEWNDQADVYITNVNSGPWQDGSHAPANGSSVIAKNANSFGYAGGGTWGPNWGTKAEFTNTGGVGDNLNFFVLYSLGTTTLAGVGMDQFDGSFWNFASDGTLTYNTAAVIPLPGAIWLLGSGLLGLAAVARRRKHPAEARSNLAAFA